MENQKEKKTTTWHAASLLALRFLSLMSLFVLRQLDWNGEQFDFSSFFTPDLSREEASC